MSKEQNFLSLVKSQNVDEVTKILQKIKKSRSSLLVSSSKHKKFNVDCQDMNGLSALHMTSSRGNHRLVLALLDSGANPNLPDRLGRTPLHCASSGGHAEAVQLLLRAGGNALIEDHKGDSSLHSACRYGHIDVVRILMKYHPDPGLRDPNEKSPICLAEKYGHDLVVKLLEKCNSDISTTNKWSYRAVMSNSKSVNEINNMKITTVTFDMTRSGPNMESINYSTTSGSAKSSNILSPRMVKNHEYSRSLDAEDLLLSNSSTPFPSNNDIRQQQRKSINISQSNSISQLSQVLIHSTNENSRLSEDDEVDSKTLSGQTKQSHHFKNLAEQPEVIYDTVKPDSNMFQMQNASQVNHNVPYKSTSGLQAPGDCPGSPDPLPPPSCAINNNHLPANTPVSTCGQNIYSTGLQKVEQEKMHSSPSYGESLHHRSGQYSSPYVTPGGMVPPVTTQGGVYNSSNRSSSTSVDSGRGSVHAGGSSDSGSKYAVPTNPYQTTSSLCPPTNQDGSHDSRSSSSSSLGSSLEQLDDGNAVPSGDSPGNLNQQHHQQQPQRTPPGQSNYPPGQAPLVNIFELKSRGASDAEIIQYWLHAMQLSCYLENFLQSGYDLLTMARMTPEDLNAIGITNPIHRKRIKIELSKMNLPDPIPDFIPESVLEWLELLELPEYSPIFVRQGLTTVNRLVQLTWEDLEEIGVKKLGHQKKLMIAVERLARLERGNSSNQFATASSSTSPKHNTNYPILDSRIPRPNQMPRTPPTPTSQRRSGGAMGQLANTGGEGTSQYSQLPEMGHGMDIRHLPQHPHHYRNSGAVGQHATQHNITQGFNPSRHSRSASLGPSISSASGGSPIPHNGTHTPPNLGSGQSTPTGGSSSRPVVRVTASLERKQRPPPPPPPKRITSIKPTTTSVSPNLQRRMMNPVAKSSGSSIPLPRNAYENCPEMLPPNHRQSTNSNYSTYGFSGSNSSASNTPSQHSPAGGKSNKPIQYVIGQPQLPQTTQYFFPSTNSSHCQSSSGLQSDAFKGNSSPKVVYRKLSDGSLRNHQLMMQRSNDAAPVSSSDLTKHSTANNQTAGPALIAQLSSSSVSSDENGSSSNRRSRSSSSQSVESITSLPFANENCSTIRHRSPGPRPALASIDFTEVDINSKMAPNYQPLQADSSMNDLTSLNSSISTVPSMLRKTLPLNLPYDTETRKRRPSMDPNPYALVRPPAVPMRRGSISTAQASAENRVQLPKMDDGDNLSTNGEFEDICDILEDLTEMLDHEMNRNKSKPSTNKEEMKKSSKPPNLDKFYNLH